MAKKSNIDTTLTRSRDIIESYIFSTSKRSFSMYSERLLLKIVECAQLQVAGANFRDGTSVGQVSIGPLGDVEIEIPIRELLGTASGTNYTQARNAIMELMQNPYFVERPKFRNGKPVLNSDGEQEFEFLGRQILNSCEVNVKPGIAVITVNRDTWAAVLDFSKGFRKYDIETAQKLTKSTSLRLFKLLSNQKYPITYTIEQLRQMWKMEDKYKDTYDFIKRTIEPAKKELDEKAPWTFDYVKNTSAGTGSAGRTGKKSVTSITFIPRQKMTMMATSSLIKTVHPKSILGQELYDTLLYKLGLTHQGIVNNMILFEAARKVGVDYDAFIEKVAPKALRAPNCAAYVIKSLKQLLKERYDIDIDKPIIEI